MDQAALLEQAYPFPDRRPVHAELLNELSLGADRLAGSNPTSKNFTLDRLCDQLIRRYRIDPIKLFASLGHFGDSLAHSKWVLFENTA